MRTLNELTEEQFKVLLNEYYAKPESRSKLTPTEIKDIAKQLNKKINIPIMYETKEEKILIKVVIKIDNFLYDHLPNEFYDLVRSLEDGINDDEARRLILRLSKLANTKIDIPYIPEKWEFYAIRMVISIVINSARKKWDLHQAQTKALTMEIPTEKNAEDERLKAMVLQ